MSQQKNNQWMKDILERKTRTSECGRQWYLGKMRGHWQWHKDLWAQLILAFCEAIS